VDRTSPDCPPLGRDAGANELCISFGVLPDRKYDHDRMESVQCYDLPSISGAEHLRTSVVASGRMDVEPDPVIVSSLTVLVDPIGHRLTLAKFDVDGVRRWRHLRRHGETAESNCYCSSDLNHGSILPPLGAAMRWRFPTKEHSRRAML
jgi:hypothetical protein